MSAEQGGRSADYDALAETLGRHVFLSGGVWHDGPVNARCTCGHEYDNPNASEGYSHPRHVAEVLVSDGWRPHPWLSDALSSSVIPPASPAPERDRAAEVEAAEDRAEQAAFDAMREAR